MTTATERPTKIEAIAEYVGHTDIHRGPTFLVPVQAIRPLNPYSMRFPAYGSGIQGGLDFGAKYRVECVKDRNDWYVTKAELA